jgi:hypothetical protein
MARKYYTPIDLNGLEIQNVKFQNLASAPTPRGEGHVYYNTQSDTLFVYDGATWQPVGKIVASAIASRPAAGSIGRFFFATDTKVLYYDNGSSWDQVSNFGTPVALDNTGTNVDGTSTNYARSDHKHAHGPDEHSGISLGDLSAANGDLDISGFKIISLGEPTNPQDASTKSYVDDKTLQSFTTAANTDIDANDNRITNLAEPQADTDAATKGYVDSVSQGLDVKLSVRAATTGDPITLSGAQTIDGVILSAGNRVLVKDQFDPADNGIYVVAAGAWSRSADANSSTNVGPGMFTFVEEGTVNADSGWVLVSDGAVTLDTTELDFVQFSGAGQITAGDGLTKDGNRLDLVVGTGLTVSADAVAVDTTVVAYKKIFSDFTATVTTGPVTQTLTHSLGNRDVTVQVYDASTFAEVECDIVRTDANTVTLTFHASGTFRAVVVG